MKRLLVKLHLNAASQCDSKDHKWMLLWSVEEASLTRTIIEDDGSIVPYKAMRII